MTSRTHFTHGKTNTLASGPSGVGKTLTAEALSEHLQRPLYTVGLASSRCYYLYKLLQISAGDLSNNLKVLKRQLSLVFELAGHWKALLLLDEADVSVRSCL
jgi:MoxR-like ATPase